MRKPTCQENYCEADFLPRRLRQSSCPLQGIRMLQNHRMKMQISAATALSVTDDDSFRRIAADFHPLLMKALISSESSLIVGLPM